MSCRFMKLCLLMFLISQKKGNDENNEKNKERKKIKAKKQKNKEKSKKKKIPNKRLVQLISFSCGKCFVVKR